MNSAFIRKKTNVQNRYQVYRVQKGSFPNSLILIACRRHLRPVYCVVYCVTESMEVPRLIGVVSPQKMRSNALLPLPGIHCTSLNAARSLAMPQSVSARMLHASEAFCSSFSMPLLHSLYPRPSIHTIHIYLACIYRLQ